MKAWTTKRNKTWTDKESVVRMFLKRVEIEQFHSVTDVYKRQNMIIIEESIKLYPNAIIATHLFMVAIKE